MTMRSRQGGMTMISWIVLIGLIGFVGIFAFKLIPIYMDYYSINRALVQVSQQLQPGESPQQVFMSISSAFDINSVNAISDKDVSIKIDPDTKTAVLGIDYDQRTSFLGNVDLIVHFEKNYPAGAH